MSLQETVKAIKRLQIQGAASIARAGLEALQEQAHASKAKTLQAFYKDMRSAETRLLKSRPTEPYLRNMLSLTLSQSSQVSTRKAREDVHRLCQHYLKQMRIWQDTIAEIGAKKIPKGGKIFIHCHSTNVMAILKEAHRKKHFTVLNTEARPLYQGRMSAKELSKAGIPVEHYVDSAARLALKEADLMLIGCDAITNERVINKIGSELFCEAAERYDVPVYVATPSLKFDPATLQGNVEPIEERPDKEVWERPPKHVHIHNPAFERINPTLIEGIITELGIYPHESLLEEIQHHYPDIT